MPTHPTSVSQPYPSRTAAATRLRLKHGLHSSRAVIPGESEDEYKEYRHDFIAELLPGSRVEEALVDQLVNSQWQLRRLWAGQSGIYAQHEQVHPPEADAPFPERVAAVRHADFAAESEIYRLTVEAQRLMNMFHKALRKLELHQDLRVKRLIARHKVDRTEYEDYTPSRGPDPVLQRLPVGWQDEPASPVLNRASPSSGNGSSEIADRGESKTPSGPAGHLPLHAGDGTPTAAGSSVPLNAGGPGSTGAGGGLQSEPTPTERRIKELTTEYWALRRQATREDTEREQALAAH